MEYNIDVTISSFSRELKRYDDLVSNLYLYSRTRLLSGHPRETGHFIDVGRLIEVQYKFGRNGCQCDFIHSISSNMVVEKCRYVNVPM